VSWDSCEEYEGRGCRLWIWWGPRAYADAAAGKGGPEDEVERGGLLTAPEGRLSELGVAVAWGTLVRRRS
jgi:hypothetical protein